MASRAQPFGRTFFAKGMLDSGAGTARPEKVMERRRLEQGLGRRHMFAVGAAQFGHWGHVVEFSVDIGGDR